jgi:hypothetical protein
MSDEHARRKPGEAEGLFSSAPIVPVGRIVVRARAGRSARPTRVVRILLTIYRTAGAARGGACARGALGGG